LNSPNYYFGIIILADPYRVLREGTKIFISAVFGPLTGQKLHLNKLLVLLAQVKISKRDFLDSPRLGRTQELPGSMNLFVKILVIIGSSASIGFGIWHFFVPKTWNWYSYIDINATIIMMLVSTSILWLTRVAFQVIYPQGSLVPGLQYGMLSAFMIVSLCYVISLIIILFQ
jgi:hypothetical protein